MENYEDKIVCSLVEDERVVVYVASSTSLVEEARVLHHTSPVATAALGRALTLTGIMGAALKEGQRVTLHINCRGPLGAILVQANSRGEVRGYVSQPLVFVPPREDKKLNVEEAVGKGSQLSVVKDLGLGEPYAGYIEMPRGSIAYDLAYYFALSEQLPSACSAGVYVGETGEVLSAGGFIIHTPAGTPPQIIEKIEDNISLLPPLSSLLWEGKAPEEITGALLSPLPYRIVGEKKLCYHCYCSRERARRTLMLLGREELEELLAEEGRAEVSCPFCNRIYLFGDRELRELIEQGSNRRFDS